MQIKLKKKNNILTVAFSGELDHHGAAEFKNELDSYLLANNAKNVIFDFKDLTFMDSSGIGAIMGRYKIIKSFGGKMAIAGANRQVDTILGISGIKKLIPVYKTTDIAKEKSGGII